MLFTLFYVIRVSAYIALFITYPRISHSYHHILIATRHGASTMASHAGSRGAALDVARFREGFGFAEGCGAELK